MTKNQILELFPIGDPQGRYILFDPVTATMGAIGAGTSLITGIMGNSAAKKAAAAQQQAAQAASDKVGVAIGDANKPIQAATTDAQQLALGAGGRVVDAAKEGAGNVAQGADQANAILDPYSQSGQAAAGTLQQGLVPGGTFNKTPTAADIQIDPGYQWRQQQGELALGRSAAARGGAISGAASKDLANYSQGLASQEYANAFNRYEQSTQNRYQNLFGVANQGLAAGSTQGANLLNSKEFGAGLTTGAANSDLGANQFAGQIGLQGASQMGANTLSGAEAQGNLLTGGAAAKAGGIVGGSNALTSGLSGAANSVSGAMTLSQLLKNPALSPGGGAAPRYSTPPTYNPSLAPNPYDTGSGG